MRANEDLTGKIIWNWKILGLSDKKTKEGKPLWICECQCENKTVKLHKRYTITSGRAKSCGCMKEQYRTQTNKQKYQNKYIFTDTDCIIIANNTGNKFYIDKEDYEKVKDYCWYETQRGYMATSINKKTIMLHRVILGLENTDSRTVDHIYHTHDGKNNFYNNKKSNLRVTTQSKNCENRAISDNNTSGKTGVSWSKNENKWVAYITYNNKRYHLGYFSNINDAINIRKQKEKELFGKYRYKETEFKNMIGTNALLLADTYKQIHRYLFPKDLTKLVSYWTPRKSMLKNQNHMVFWGLQGFIKEILVDYFNRNFFKVPVEKIKEEYSYYMNVQIGEGNFDLKSVIELHELGYLPLQIRALPEGTLVPMGIPCIEVTNTHPDFAWLTQWVECILQNALWKPCAHATIGRMYRELANYWYEKTVTDSSPSLAACDFGMRGMSSMEEAIHASASWLLSFDKTSTIPALPYIEQVYNANCKESKIGISAISTEHAVMASNYAVDGDEITFVKRMLTELYPNASFSMVSDTYDYWNIIDNILPACKEEIMQHNGKLLVRPDSGDMVEIAVKTIEKLWNVFGGTVNSKGYKVLDPHIGIIYGDGCTLNNVEQVWEELKKKGFAANNIVFGVGAFCFSAVIEPDGHMVVVTRDMFGIAMKATYGIVNGEPIMIYKDPKTDTSHLKKSHKGCCHIYYDDNEELQCEDGYDDVFRNGALSTVFINGIVCSKETFEDIRERLNGGSKDE